MPESRERKLLDGYSIVETHWCALDKSERQTVLQILKAGGAVSVESAKKELPHVTTLLLLRHHDAIVGIATIKQPRVSYALGTQSPQKSNHAFDPEMLELGYIVVHGDHRKKKLSGALTSELLARHGGPLFATTDDQNMKYALGNRGFTQRGNEWNGKRATLSLWLRESVP